MKIRNTIIAATVLLGFTAAQAMSLELSKSYSSSIDKLDHHNGSSVSLINSTESGYLYGVSMAKNVGISKDNGLIMTHMSTQLKGVIGYEFGKGEDIPFAKISAGYGIGISCEMDISNESILAECVGMKNESVVELEGGMKHTFATGIAVAGSVVSTGYLSEGSSFSDTGSIGVKMTLMLPLFV